MEEGDDIIPEPAPTMEGYSFSGWSEIPETMPAHDVVITGTFTKIILDKCATPTIAYDKGELVFSCETDGVTFVSEVKVADAKTNEGERVQLTACYVVTVYATKDGYDNSDVATTTIGWRNGRPVMEGFSSVTLEDDESDGDVNNDGKIDVGDLITIISKIAAK